MILLKGFPAFWKLMKTKWRYRLISKQCTSKSKEPKTAYRIIHEAFVPLYGWAWKWSQNWVKNSWCCTNSTKAYTIIDYSSNFYKNTLLARCIHILYALWLWLKWFAALANGLSINVSKIFFNFILLMYEIGFTAYGFNV